MPPSVSLPLIACNEEAKLPACLQSIAAIANEIIVLDTGSTDRTKQVAADLGAKVFDFPWVEDFAAARNECLRHATDDYIFWMDADEVIDPINREKLRALFETLPPITDGSPPNAHRLLAYAMKRRCLPDPQSGIATVVDHIRLFPNHPQIRWKYRVHEQILPALNQLGIPVVGTDIVIDHTGYQDPAVVQRKTERNLRLLELDYADHPDDPFILFNLGWTHLTMGNAPKALGFLRQSLERSNPGDSIVRKIYALLAQTHLRLGQPGEALAACRAGRARYPQDDELLMMQGRLLEGSGNLAGAEACYRQLVVVSEESYPRIDTNRHEERKENNHGEHGETNQGLPPTTHDSPLTPHFSPAQFLSVEEGLRGYKARFHLAMACRRQGKDKEAEEQLQAVAGERPEFAPAWLELARLYFSQARWPELDEVVDRVLAKESDPRRDTNRHEESGPNPPTPFPEREGGAGSPPRFGEGSGERWKWTEPLNMEPAVLKARGLLARQEFGPARQILEEIIAHNPQWPYPRVILSYVFLQQEDLAAAERVLRDLLVLDPTQLEAWMNLAKLLRSQRRMPEALAACRSGTVHCPNDLDLPWLHGTLLHEAGDLIGAEACFLAVASGPPELANGSAELSSRARERYISARHQLALIYLELRRPSDAEAQWREVLAECPDHAAARQGLLDLHRTHRPNALPEPVAT